MGLVKRKWLVLDLLRHDCYTLNKCGVNRVAERCNPNIFVSNCENGMLC